MNIRYRNAPVFLEGAQPETWLEGTLINGNTAIELAPGVYLSVQPDGTFQTRTAIGAWETCELNPANNTVTYKATGLAYVIPIRGR